MTKILIIGSNGTLGTELIAANQEFNVTAWDRNILDITDKTEVDTKLDQLQPNIIYNCAAYTAVDKAEEDYATAELINGIAPGYLAQSCKTINATLVHFSTGMIFDGDDQDGYNETANPNPINAYGKTKLLGEEAIRSHTDNYYIIRTEWLYGKPSSLDAKKSFNEIMIELGRQGPVKVIDNEYGRPTWAKDLAYAAKQLVAMNNPFGIYHITNSAQASRAEWAREIYRILDMETEVIPVSSQEFTRQAPRPVYELLNSTKLPPLRSWQEALQDYLTTQ